MYSNFRQQKLQQNKNITPILVYKIWLQVERETKRRRVVVSNFKTADTITRPKRFAPWEIRFRRSSFTIPSTKNIGAREIFREPRRVTSFVTRHRRRGGGRGKRSNTENYGSKTRYTHYNPIKSPRWVRHRQSEAKFMPILPLLPTPIYKVPGCDTRSRSRDIEKFASDLFKRRFTRFSSKKPR